jgi:hypothetical protein
VTDLRPLSLGEILDRAVTLSVRNIIPFASIWLVFEFPQNLVFYALNVTHSSLQVQGFCLVVSSFIAFIPGAALAWAACRSYEGKREGFAATYGVGFRRFPANIAFNVLWLAVSLISLVPFLIAAFLIAMIFGIVEVAFAGAAVAIAVVLAVPVAIVFFGAGAIATAAYITGWFAVVVEGASPRAALTAAIRRSFRHGMRVRSFSGGFAYWALTLGLILIVGGGAAGFEVLKVPLAAELWGIVGAPLVVTLAYIYTTAFIAVFYFDVRVRDEGLDLQLAAQSLDLEPVSTA